MTTSPTPAWGSRFTSEIPDSILGPALPPEARRGVVVPEATFLDVAAHDGGRAPAAVAHDGQLWGSRGIALSCEAGAQGMTRETSVESGGQRTTADHLGHGAIAEAGSCDPAVLGGPPYLARDSRRGRWGSPGGGAGPREVDARYLRGTWQVDQGHQPGRQGRCRAGLAGNAVRHLLAVSWISGCRQIVPGPCLALLLSAVAGLCS